MLYTGGFNACFNRDRKEYCVHFKEFYQFGINYLYIESQTHTIIVSAQISSPFNSFHLFGERNPPILTKRKSANVMLGVSTLIRGESLLKAQDLVQTWLQAGRKGIWVKRQTIKEWEKQKMKIQYHRRAYWDLIHSFLAIPSFRRNNHSSLQ